MATTPLTDAQLREAVAVVRAAGSIRGAALRANIAEPTLRHRVQEAIRRGIARKDEIPRGIGGNAPTTGRGGGVAPGGSIPRPKARDGSTKILAGPPEQKVSDTANAETGERTLETLGPRLRTVDQVLAHAEVDKGHWRVRAVRVNSWEGFYKDDDGNSHVVPLFQVRVDLKAKRITDPDVVRDTMIEAMKRWAPRYGHVTTARARQSGKGAAGGTPRHRAHAARKGDVLLEIAVPDLHIGKLAWGPETGGEHYDSRRAVGVYQRVAAALLEQAVRGWGDRIGRILLPVGNDLLHVDTEENTTTAGTRMDVDTRHQKSFRMAVEMLVASIEDLAARAPVDVVVVPGNHDRQRAFYVGEVLGAWFHAHPRIRIENSPTLRKYVRFGRTLLMFTHGCDEKGRDLAQIMAHERPRDWADTTTRESHHGHWHTRREVRHTAGDTHLGFAERILPSLSGTDAWHHRKGYVHGPKEATALLYGREQGYIGQFCARAPRGTYA